MNSTTTPNSSGAAGLPRAVWIGGGLMGLTIIALATTLVVKGNGNDTAADSTATPLVATTTTAGSPVSQQSSVANPDAKAPANESTTTKPTHHAATPVHHESGKATTPAAQPQQQVAAAAPVCATCGVIEGYAPVTVQGKNNGVGAVAGGLGGALIGSKIAGRGNHTLGGAIGAVGGGLLGNAIETHERTSTAYDVRVRMEDGTVRTVRQATVPTVGQHVNVEGNTLKAVAAQG